MCLRTLWAFIYPTNVGRLSPLLTNDQIEQFLDMVAWFYKRELVDKANVASEVRSFACMFPHRHYAR